MESTPTYPDPDWDSCGRHHVLFSSVADLSTLQSLLDTPPPGALTVIHLRPDVGTPQDLVPPVLPADVGCCSGCLRMLFVRDHFWRRLGAYMRFQVDAETPSGLPEVQHFYG
jgi:hypothetical protein